MTLRKRNAELKNIEGAIKSSKKDLNNLKETKAHVI
jgi:hypothetical protein